MDGDRRHKHKTPGSEMKDSLLSIAIARHRLSSFCTNFQNSNCHTETEPPRHPSMLEDFKQACPFILFTIQTSLKSQCGSKSSQCFTLLDEQKYKKPTEDFFSRVKCTIYVS